MLTRAGARRWLERALRVHLGRGARGRRGQARGVGSFGRLGHVEQHYSARRKLNGVCERRGGAHALPRSSSDSIGTDES